MSFTIFAAAFGSARVTFSLRNFLRPQKVSSRHTAFNEVLPRAVESSLRIVVFFANVLKLATLRMRKAVFDAARNIRAAWKTKFDPLGELLLGSR